MGKLEDKRAQAKAQKRRHKDDDGDLTRRKLLLAQKRFLEALEQENALRDGTQDFHEKVEGVGKHPEPIIEPKLSNRQAKRRRRALAAELSKAGKRISGWEQQHAKLGIREILRPYRGGRRLLDRVPTDQAPMTAKEYTRYLQTPHWQDFNREYREADDVLHVCFVCDNPSFELHHHTYVRLGQETFEDVVPLCSAHHRAVHKAVKAGVKLANAHTYVKMRFQRDELETHRRSLKTEEQRL